MARPERFELPTLWFEARCSIQLSYGRVACHFTNFSAKLRKYLQRASRKRELSRAKQWPPRRKTSDRDANQNEWNRWNTASFTDQIVKFAFVISDAR